MVAAVRRGRSLQAVARQFHVALRTVQRWVARAGQQRLDRVDWSDQPRGGRHAKNSTATAVEDQVLALRRQLQDSSDLGEFGAAAILQELQARHFTPRPSLRTIGRILLRRGALDGRHRVRRPPPPKGWYLPPLAQGQAELDAFDIVEGLVIKGQGDVEVFNAISLHGGLCGSWVGRHWTAKTIVPRLLEHWQAHGLPDYAQFDNDPLFQGPRHLPDALGRIVRLCLQLQISPVFAVPRETGFQASIESYNGRWQAKVWARFTHASHHDLAACSDRYVAAAHQRSAARREAAPPRRPFPANWQLDWQRPLAGCLVYLRRTDPQGQIQCLGRRYLVDPHWTHRLVRAEVDFDRQCIRCYRLRRREPKHQPLIRTIPYQPRTKPFHD
jgi:transposase